MHPRKRDLGVLATAVLLAFAVTACHKRRVVAPTIPAATTAPAPVPTVSLSAQPSTIEKGQSATLTWSSTGATELDLEPNIGEVQTSGTKAVSPSVSTTYTLTAHGPGGTSTSIARITVTQPPASAGVAPPPTAPSVTEENLFETNIKDAFFNFDSSDIRPDAAKALTTDAAYLKAHPNLKITIGGHCDERGSEEYNLGLGDRRARSAKAFLVNLGIASDRIATVSFGKDRPFCTEHTETCWQQNRRAHIVPQTPGS